MTMRSCAAYLTIAVLLLGNSGFAAGFSAVLNSTGKVQINGSYVPATTPVFAGDRIETTDSSMGTVSLSNTSINIQNSSQVALGNDSAEVVSGAAKIKTSGNYAALVQGLAITPKKAIAEYLVVNQGSKVYISALNGDLMVGAGITVPSGRSVTLAATSAATAKPQGAGCVEDKKVDESGKFLLDRLGRYIRCSDQTGGVGTTTSEFSTRTWTIVGFGAAGAAGAISAIVISNEKSPTSPAVP